MQPDNTKALCL